MKSSAEIPVDEGLLSVVNAGPAMGAEILAGGIRRSWIDPGMILGSQGIHLATNADAGQSVRVTLEVDEDPAEPEGDGWESVLVGTVSWTIPEVIVESEDLERRPLLEVVPGAYRVRVWVKGMLDSSAGLEDWRRRVVEWSDTGRNGPLPTPEPSSETWLIQAFREATP
jgi:hypothetical protein